MTQNLDSDFPKQKCNYCLVTRGPQVEQFSSRLAGRVFFIGGGEPRVVSDPPWITSRKLLHMLAFPRRCWYSLASASDLNDCWAHVASLSFHHLAHLPKLRDDSSQR